MMYNYELWSHVQENCEKYGGGYSRRGYSKKPKYCWRDPAEKPEPIPYNVNALIEAAEVWINGNEDYYEKLRKYKASRSSENYAEYGRADAVQSAAYDGLRIVCKAVGADSAAVLAVVKCFRRYSQYRTGWNFVAEWHMGQREHDGFRRCVQA